MHSPGGTGDRFKALRHLQVSCSVKPRWEGNRCRSFICDCPGRIRLALLSALLLAVIPPVRAGSQLLTASNTPWPTPAVEIDELSRSLAEVNQAIKSFQKSDFEACLQQLGKAVKAHPELPPAQALLAKLAFLSNQTGADPSLPGAGGGARTRSTLRFTSFLATWPCSRTDRPTRPVHFEKARALAAAKRWTGDAAAAIRAVLPSGHGDPVAESRGDWKAARTALEGWLAHEPANARARQRLGKALFNLDQQEAAYEELQKAAKADSTLEPPAITMGWLFTRAGNAKKAEEWMDYAVKTSPDSFPFAWAWPPGCSSRAAATKPRARPRPPRKSSPSRTMSSGCSAWRHGSGEDLADSRADLPGTAGPVARRRLGAQPVGPGPGGTDRRRKATPGRRACRAGREARSPSLPARWRRWAPSISASSGSTTPRSCWPAVFQGGQSQSDDVLALARVEDARGKNDMVVPLLKKALDVPRASSSNGMRHSAGSKSWRRPPKQ